MVNSLDLELSYSVWMLATCRVIVSCFGARHVAIYMLLSLPRCINGY